MTIIGHKLIDYPKFFRALKVADVHNSSPKDIVLACGEGREGLWKFLCDNRVTYATEALSIRDAVILNALKATYIVVSNRELAESIQQVANEYLFDSKILLAIEHEEQIEECAKLGIDGVIYKGVIDGEF